MLTIIIIIWLLYLAVAGILTLSNIPFGVLGRIESFWIGLHYSKHCKRYCLNIIPCITIWWTKKDGLPVTKFKM